MKIHELILNNYRNYQNIHLHFHPYLNIFVGNNAQGKTNIIESLYISGIGKSYRTNRESELIKWDQNFYKINTKIKDKERSIIIELAYNLQKSKSLKINGVPKKRMGELIGVLRVVLFAPEHLLLVKGGPSERRKFIDVNISQINPKYLFNLQQYHKILHQRNTLLRNVKTKSDNLESLQIWDYQLAEYGSQIISKRFDFIEKISHEATQLHKLISDNKELIELEYKTIDKNNNVYEIKEKLIYKLGKMRHEDCIRGFTTVGPHRDDFNILINGMDAKNFGSQGQQRTATLSLKLAEVEYIKEETGTYPVLLLDDVMSELDIKRREFLLSAIKDKVQTFITTTNLNSFDDYNLKNSLVFQVIKGNVSLKGG